MWGLRLFAATPRRGILLDNSQSLLFHLFSLLFFRVFIILSHGDAAMKLVSQRISRSYRFLVAFIVIAFIATVTFRHDSILSWSKSHKAAPSSASEEIEQPEQPEIRPINRPLLPPGQCTPEIDFLRRTELDLTDTISYTRRCVKPYWGKPDRDVVANLSQPLVTYKTMVNLTSCTHHDIPPCETYILPTNSAKPRGRHETDEKRCYRNPAD